MLKSPLNRKIDYLRISVTDRCNLRCLYCMPANGIVNKSQDQVLKFEEILKLAGIFSSLGVKKIRLTGGEPLIRKGLIGLIRDLSNIDGVEELCLTTNGALLHYYAEELKKAGVERVNISLDTLKEDRFRKITRRNCFKHVMEGIDKAARLNFRHLRLNMVVMKGINSDEITDFIDFAQSKGLTLRFIEFMKITPLWKKEYFIPIEEVKKVCKSKLSLIKLGKLDYGPAIYYRVGNDGLLGFIKTDQSNCRCCNRVRLSATGELKLCLYETGGISLKDLLRSGVSDWEIRESIKTRISIKDDIDYKNYESHKCYMCNIGG